MNNSSKAQVIEKQTQEVLFECEVSEIEKAYKYASDMEAMDLEVEVLAPGLPQTLIDQLGMDEAQSHFPHRAPTSRLLTKFGRCLNPAFGVKLEAVVLSQCHAVQDMQHGSCLA